MAEKIFSYKFFD